MPPYGGFTYYFSNILFAKDGEVYSFDGYKCMVIGGAYSVDKHYRLANGWSWFSTEQPSDEIKQYVEDELEKREQAKEAERLRIQKIQEEFQEKRDREEYERLKAKFGGV